MIMYFNIQINTHFLHSFTFLCKTSLYAKTFQPFKKALYFIAYAFQELFLKDWDKKSNFRVKT
jgi:hypothetical protein